MRKRSLALVLCLCIVFSLFPVSALAAERGLVADETVDASFVDVNLEKQEDVAASIAGDEVPTQVSERVYYTDNTTGLSYYLVNHMNGDGAGGNIMDGSSLMAESNKLVPPTNLRWETQARTYYLQQPDGNLRVNICAGTTSWTDTVNNTREYEVEIYDEKGESVSRIGHTFNHLIGSVTDFEADDFLTCVEESGTYTFSVRAINTYDREFSSDPAFSGTWVYTKPSVKLSTPAGINIVGSNLSWNGVSGADGYQFECTYSDTINGEKKDRSGGTDRNGGNHTETDVSWLLTVSEEEARWGYDGRYHHFRVRSLSNDITKICNSPWSNYLTYDCSTGTVIQGDNTPGQGDDTPDTPPIEVSDKVVKSSNLTLQSVVYEYTAGGRIAENNKDAVGGLNITFVVAGPASVCEVRTATWSETLWSDSEINSEVSEYISLWKEPGKTLQAQTMPYTETNSRPVRESELGKTEYILLVALDPNMDAVGYAVIQVAIPAGESVDPVSSYVSFYPENGATYDFENPSNGTSSTNYEDGKLRIFFNKEAASVSGRAQLDFSVGTLQIHRASDNQVVYEVSENVTNPGTSANVLLWGTTSPYQAVRLENVQPYLEHSTEYYVTIPEGFFKFSDGTYCSELAKGAWTFETPKGIECHPPLEQIDGKYEFSFRSMIVNDNDMTYTYSYDESWFAEESTTYQHDLVKMSIRAAMAAYGTDFKQSSDRNIRELMENNLHFENYYSNYPVPNPDKPDVIGYAIGSKNIKIDDEHSFALIMVAVRGGGYYDEWGGNFNVGTNTEHAGFSIAANTVLSAIQNYLDKYSSNLVSEKKIWIMGYSRGAATTNLVAKYLDDGRVPGIRQKNVFAFCFECPQNTMSTQAERARYNNIVSIVNPVDFVPKVAMTDWGYGRYGKTYFTPYRAGLVSLRYRKLEDDMRDCYNSLLDYNTVTAKTRLIPTTRFQEQELDMVFGAIASLWKNPRYYTDNVQTRAMNIAIESLGSAGGDSDFMGFLDGFRKLTTVGSLNGEPISVITRPLAAFAEDMFLAHYAELCMAWLDSLHGEFEYSSSKYRMMFINCPVDIDVYDSNHSIVGKIIDDQPVEIENGVLIYVDNDGQKVIILPEEEEYVISMQSTGNGFVTYTATEYNMDGGITENLVSYHDIAVEEGTQLTGTVGKMEDDTVTSYPLTKGEEELTPDVSVSGDEVKEYTVTVNKSGNGNAIGGGKYLSGEFSQVTATANAGETFLGWYHVDTQISTDSEYRFCVTEDMTITAKFTSNTSDSGNTPSGSGISGGSGGSGSGGGSHSESYSITVPSKSQGGQVVSDSSSAKSGKIVTLTVTPDNGYELDSLSVKYGKNKEVALEDKGNGEYTFSMPARNVTVEVLFKASSQDTAPPDTGDTDMESQPNKPIQTNPFSDVTESAYYYDAVMWAVTNNVTNGRTPTTFEPGMSCTRAQTVTFLWRAAGSPEPVSNENPFSDISENAYFYKAVLWAVEQGITKGTTVTTFAPGNTVSRAQVVTFLYRSANSPSIVNGDNPFTDVPQSSYYHDAVTWASKNGVTQGKTSTTFNPSENCNRGQIVTFLYRHFVK